MAKSNKKSAKNIVSASSTRRSGTKGDFSPRMRAVIIVLIVVLALSTIGTAIASVFSASLSSSSSSSTDSTTTDGDTASSDDDAGEESSDETEDSISEAAQLDVDYADYLASLESSYEADPTDTATILALARNSQDLADSIAAVASDETETERSRELYAQAISWYDLYLEKQSSNAARINRALCLYSLGETEDALSTLELITKNSSDYALAWAYLGWMYEQDGRTDEATEAYETAIELDSADEYGAKTYAQNLLDELEAAQEEQTEAEDGEEAEDATNTETEDASEASSTETE